MQFPNLHPAFVHFPIAFLLLGSVTGLLYLHWQQTHELRTVTRWSIVLGWVATVVAIGTGLLAQSGLPPRPSYESVLNGHIASGLALLILYATLLYMYWLRRNRMRAQEAETLQADPLLDDPRAKRQISILLLLGIALVIVTGWNGGRLVYHWGVNVGL